MQKKKKETKPMADINEGTDETSQVVDEAKAMLSSTLKAGLSDLQSNLQPWVDRATDMMRARPGVTLGAAVGTGFILGATLFSRPGRFLLLGALGVGAELLQRSIKEGIRAERPVLEAQ